MGAGAGRTRETRPGRRLQLLLLLLLLPLLEAAPPLTPRAEDPLPPAPSRGQGPRDITNPVCGKPKVVGKVFGGQDVVAGQWPWQASLLHRDLHLCGAVLIDSLWVVSAAHCFLNKSHAPEDYQVLLGYTQLYQQTQHTWKMSVNRIITHPDFEKFHPFGSDIAMLQLQLPVNFTSYIIPACLPPPDVQLLTYKSCWITGWGMLSEDMRLLPPFHLQEGKVSLIENEICNMLYGQRTAQGKITVHEEMLCAGDFLSGKAICDGDSGGPLVCQLSSVWVLVGLASWGLDCQPPIYPSVFTRVAYFASWINGIKRATPVPDPVSAPSQTQVSGQLRGAACSPRLCTSLVPPLTLLLLLYVLRAWWYTLW